MVLVAVKYGSMSPLDCGLKTNLELDMTLLKYFSVIYAMLEIELENENGQMT